MPPAERPALHLITDEQRPESVLVAAIAAAAGAGVDWVHVRRPGAAARDLFALAQAVVALCRPRGVRVAVNDRLDVALAVGADAVQLGGRSLPVAAARRIAGPLQLGVSVHSVEEAATAAAAGADWLLFGHVYATASHLDEPPRGLAHLAEAVATAAPVPVVAIGGIGLDQVEPVLTAGAAGIAVISAILAAPDPAQATAALRQALDRATSY